MYVCMHARMYVHNTRHDGGVQAPRAKKYYLYVYMYICMHVHMYVHNTGHDGGVQAPRAKKYYQYVCMYVCMYVQHMQQNKLVSRIRLNASSFPRGVPVQYI